jgi:excisionase family DNA binding protein
MTKNVGTRKAAEALGVHPNTVLGWIEKGVIRAYNLKGSYLNSSWRIPVTEIIRILAERRAQLKGPAAGSPRPNPP